MSMSKNSFRLLVVGISAIVGLIVFSVMFDVSSVRGDQVGVMETWSGGVMPDPLPSKTYFCMPWQRITTYPLSVNVFSMNDKGGEMGAYLVQSLDSQDMYLSLQVQWRIDPVSVVSLHKTVGATNIEERVLRPTLLRVVKDEATTREAVLAYSGDGLVKLQQDIEKDLNKVDGELRARGVIVDSFVIEHIRLDPLYVAEITGRQISMQKEKRAVQEERTAQAMALKVKAESQADLNKAVVEAQRDKEVAILKSEADNETKILVAKADAEKVILAANAEKESALAKSEAILALGKANAESEKLKFAAYSADGAEVYARIEVAKSMALAFGNIKGYLPESMHVYTLGDSFLKAVENVVGKSVVPAVTKK